MEVPKEIMTPSFSSHTMNMILTASNSPFGMEPTVSTTMTSTVSPFSQMSKLSTTQKMTPKFL